MTSRAFTLLEVLVVIAILAIASGAIGWRMHKAVAHKQFTSQVERLQVRLIVGRKLALAMQADWKGKLRKEEKGWVFELVCEEVEAKKMAPLHLDALQISFNGRPVHEWEIDFFASGKLEPVGTLTLSKEEEKVDWNYGEILGWEAGQKLGPSGPK